MNYDNRNQKSKLYKYNTISKQCLFCNSSYVYNRYGKWFIIIYYSITLRIDC